MLLARDQEGKNYGKQSTSPPTKLGSSSTSNLATALTKTNELAPISAPTSLFSTLSNSILPTLHHGYDP